VERDIESLPLQCLSAYILREQINYGEKKMSYDETVKDLRNKFDETVASVPRFDQLSEKQRHSIINYFADSKSLIQEVIGFLTTLPNKVIEYSPIQTSEQANRTLHELQHTLTQILNFEPIQHESPAQQRQNLIKLLSDHYQNAFTTLSPLIGIYAHREGAPDFEARSADAERFLEEISEKAKKVDTILEAVQSASAQVGTKVYSDIFLKEFGTHNSQSKKWLAWTIALSIFGVIAITALIWLNPLEDTELASIINFASGKLFVISVFYVLIALFIKNYTASKHNAVLNKHRHNALSIFPTLSESALSDHTRDTILRQATEAIFGMQKTGFISREPETGGLKQFTEIIGRIPPEASN
jgi:uncharacterized protein YheU (UPF0270 family)